MNERQMQFGVGVVVLFTLIIAGLLVTLHAPLTGWLPWGPRTYQIGIQLPEAPGVGPNTPVRRNGILIGRVREIEDRLDGVLVRAHIEADRPLYPEFKPQVRSTVLGDATIDFATRPPAPGSQPVPDGTVFQGQVAPSPFDAIAKLGDLEDDIERTMDALARAGDEVASLAQRVNQAIGEETEVGRVTRLLDTTERAMQQFAQTMSAINEIFGDDPSVLRQPTQRARPPGEQQQPTNQQQPLNMRQGTAAQMVHMQQPVQVPPPADPPPLVNGELLVDREPIVGPELRRRLREGLYELPEAIHEMNVAMREFRIVLRSAERNFRNLEGFTEPLGRHGDEMAASFIRTVEGVDQLVAQLSEVTRAITNRHGTIGRLLFDPQIYENLNRLIVNSNVVLGNLSDVAVRLRPVVDDARVFMDKVAREPGRLVTGGLNPSAIK